MIEKSIIALLLLTIFYMWYNNRRKIAVKNLEIQNLVEKSNCINQPVEFLDVEIKKTEEHISMHIDDWDEIVITHPIFNQTYLYSIMNIFNNLQFVKRVYIASNGLVRIDIKGNLDNYNEDIAIHSTTHGELTIIRSNKKGFDELEDVVIEEIIKHTNAIKQRVRA